MLSVRQVLIGYFILDLVAACIVPTEAAGYVWLMALGWLTGGLILSKRGRGPYLAPFGAGASQGHQESSSSLVGQ